ncbi:ferrous iron transport protein B [Nocardia sp. 2]|uniref:Ferrous iron transport protein B n=1 Tax=Nocardia acididurans TaxID=2802282 RepID=A0ABS1LYR7_9NOCA|nr:ferrous iron transport protein B [Nocardia acididurans]MBL1073562.1 ferrous iron transport protein B [Nocardia acididurans]
MSESCCGDTGSTTGATLTATASVALVGNPNVGKSTLFNAATGARQRVGNWPGTTVGVTEGEWRLDPGHALRLIDLPGTYSLLPISPDEAVTRDALYDPGNPPDVVVAVADAANLARSLYLVSQVLEVGLPVVVALTMTDIAADRGIDVDPQRLSMALGVPVATVNARNGNGTAALAHAVGEALTLRTVPASPRLDAIGDADSLADDDDPELLVAERRYAWAHEVLAQTVGESRATTTLSDRVDRVLTHRWFGVPIFLAVMWAVFELTTTVAAPLQDRLGDFVTGTVADGVRGFLTELHAPEPVVGLLCDGVINGVGQLLSFVPLMLIMFMLLGLLEDSGYMARAAFVADRLMRTMGLPGRAFLPLIVGFGCNVPAISGTRVLANPRHRMLTALLIPFVSCNARLVVYMMLASVFFEQGAGTVVFAMYVVSIALVVVMGLLLRGTLFRDMASEPLVLDLPPYRRPSLRVLGMHTRQKMSGFLRTASGIIVATVTVVWLLASIPLGAGTFGHVDPADSVLGGVSSAISPIFAPAGFDDWHASAALTTGFVAKEAVVATVAQSYSMDDPGDGGAPAPLADALRDTFDHSSGGHALPAVLAFMIFLLAYTPCMTTLAVLRQEVGTRMTLFSVALQLSVAWVLAVAVFQVGRIFW